jgi:hypothetical protein
MANAMSVSLKALPGHPDYGTNIDMLVTEIWTLFQRMKYFFFSDGADLENPAPTTEAMYKISTSAQLVRTGCFIYPVFCIKSLVNPLQFCLLPYLSCNKVSATDE